MKLNLFGCELQIVINCQKKQMMPRTQFYVTTVTANAVYEQIPVSYLHTWYTLVIYLGRHIGSKMSTSSPFGIYFLYLPILINIYAKFGISSLSTLGCANTFNIYFQTAYWIQDGGSFPIPLSFHDHVLIIKKWCQLWCF